MILQALYEYYNRKLAINEIDPIGFLTKEIDFIVIINSEGEYVDFENHQLQIGKKIRGTPLRVPAIGKQALKHDNSGKDANLLWDKAEFVFGVGKSGRNKLNYFLETINYYYPSPLADVKSILKFYEKEMLKKYPFEMILENKEIGELLKTGKPNVTFKIDGKKIPIINETHINKAISDKKPKKIKLGTCLITGDINVPIESTHMVTKGIKGSQTSGANLISFNKPSFLSYRKEQSENAPVSKISAESYTKALQSLIDSEHNRVRVADSTIVFWAEKQTEEVNPEEMFTFLVAQTKDRDDPNKGVQVIESFINSIFTGQYSFAGTNHFYVLGLSPNAARISVRFWKAPSVEDFGQNIKKHFDDFEIVHKDYQSKYLSLYEILSSISLETKKRDKPNVIYFRGKFYDVIPNLTGALIEAIIDGSQYPLTLLQQCIIRIRAEASKKDKNGKNIPNVSYPRAAILKACLDRKFQIQNSINKEVKMSLDKTNNNIGYLLGRLFSVIERAQFVSNGYKEPNAGVRDRFWGSFSSSPISTLPIIEKLYGHHLKKIKNIRKYYEANLLEENKKEIVDKLDPLNIPAHLTLDQQALFSIGYYHQKLDLEKFRLYTKDIQSNNN